MRYEITIDGEKATIYPPDACKDYLIADCGGWIDGVFDTEATCIAAFKLTRRDDIDGWSILSDLAEQVCHCDGENRAITVNDLAV